MASLANPIPLPDLSGIGGYRFIYTYASGWQYAMYVKKPPPSTTAATPGTWAAGG